MNVGIGSRFVGIEGDVWLILEGKRERRRTYPRGAFLPDNEGALDKSGSGVVDAI